MRRVPGASVIGFAVLRTRRMSVQAIAIVVTSLVLAACAGTNSEPAAQGYNDADVVFATQMIPHHEQAVDMVQITEGRELSPEFAELTQAMKAAQTDEIGLMESWLDAWGVDPDTAASDHMAMMDDDSMGMMSDDDFASLQDAAPGGFEAMWMTMMIEHHEGAIEMAQDQLADGTNPDVSALATDIVAAQEAEIAQMKAMIAAG